MRIGVRGGAAWALLATGCAAWAQNAASAPPTPNADSTPTPPIIQAKAAFVLNAQTGKTLFARNPDKPLPPASTTKILTALLFARAVSPQQSVVASPAAVATPGSRLGMKAGERFLARDLLYAIMLHSANDASVAAAESAAGTTEKFVAQMNAEARKMGATHSHFVNPHGLNAPSHFATARDLATLAREALRNPQFAEAARTRTYRVSRQDGQPPTKLDNTDSPLWSYPGADGVKTGWTRAAGYCFVGSATRHGRRIITVLLNSPNWQGETAALLDYGFARLRVTPERQASPRSPALPGAASQSPAKASEGGKQLSQTGAPTPKLASSAPTPDEDVPDSPPPIEKPVAAPAVKGPSAFRTPGQSVAHPDGATNPPMGSAPRPPAGMPHSSAGAPNPRQAPGSTGTTETNAKPSTLLAGDQSHWRRFAPAGWKTPHFSRLWLLLALLLLGLLLAARRRLRNGKPIMKSLRDTLSALSRRAKRRPVEAPKPPVAAEDEERKPPRRMPPPAASFPLLSPLHGRRNGRDWLESVLETPRLLEPATRRQARALLDADPRAWEDKIGALLAASAPKVRVVAADLIASRSPRRAEETLLDILDDPNAPAEVHADAIRQLSARGGDRHEALFLRALLQGSVPAARALASLPRLDESTRAALRRAVAAPAEKDVDSADLRAHLLAAQSASVLAVHGDMDPDEATEVLRSLPDNHRDSVTVGVLHGVSSAWAVDRLTETALHGHAYPALQALLECDPAQARDSLAARQETLDGPASVRADVVKWLVLGEGEESQIVRLAEAGDELASSARDLARTHRFSLAQTPPDALLAAAQIASLRLGFSPYPQERIAAMFHAVATGDADPALPAPPPELAPLAKAYARPEVHDAVQAALHTEDGMSQLLAHLARHPENELTQQELAFWSDKTPAATRLLLTHALSDAEGATARCAVAARAADPDPMTRNVALRALHAQSRETGEWPDYAAPESPQETPLAA